MKESEAINLGENSVREKDSTQRAQRMMGIAEKKCSSIGKQTRDAEVLRGDRGDLPRSEPGEWPGSLMNLRRRSVSDTN